MRTLLFTILVLSSVANAETPVELGMAIDRLAAASATDAQSLEYHTIYAVNFPQVTKEIYEKALVEMSPLNTKQWNDIRVAFVAEHGCSREIVDAIVDAAFLSGITRADSLFINAQRKPHIIDIKFENREKYETQLANELSEVLRLRTLAIQTCKPKPAASKN